MCSNCKIYIYIGTISDRYYMHDYGSYSDHILLYVIATILTIAICYLIMIIVSICGFIGGKYHEKNKKQSSKYDRVSYDAVNINEDEVWISLPFYIKEISNLNIF